MKDSPTTLPTVPPRADLMAAITKTLIRHPSGACFEKLVWMILKNYDVSLSLKECLHTVEYMKMQGIVYKGKSDRYYMAKNDNPAAHSEKRRQSAKVARTVRAQKRKEEINEGQSLLG